MIARLAGQIFPDTLTPETVGVLNKEEKIIAQNRTLWSHEETKDFSPHEEFTCGSGIILGMDDKPDDKPAAEEAKDDTANEIEKLIAVSNADTHASDAVTRPVETAIFQLIADTA
eukprot:1089440-Prymnesium_polylepis.1